MEKNAFWSENRVVRFSDIDKSDSMTLHAVLDFFQESAISHAEVLGVGREALARTNQVWILSRMSVLVQRRPGYCENVTIRTWPRGGEKLFVLRDYNITDSGGQTAVRARSGWLVIDIEKRRPLRPQSILETMPKNEGLNALSAAVGLEERPGLIKAAERRALYNDVDYNGHVNNISYVKWIEDTLEPSLLEQAKSIRLDINYLNEVLPGETADILYSQIQLNEPAVDAKQLSARAFAFEGKKQSAFASANAGGQPAFRAELRLWL